jgi:hypothetical protein
MANYNSITRIEGGFGTFPVANGTTLTNLTRVKLLSDGSVAAAGAQENAIGVVDSLQQKTATVGYVSVRYLNAQGEQFGIAVNSVTINVGDSVYQAASGLLTNVSTNAYFAGIAKSAVASTAAPVQFTYIAFPKLA